MASRNFFVHQNYVLMDRFYPLLKGVGALESLMLKDRFSAIDRPVFVCGLARSGTSVATQMLHTHNDLGSFVYQDLPLLMMPYAWNFVSGAYYKGVKPQARPHKDGLQVAPGTPDAFEEFFWRKELDYYEAGRFCRWLEDDFDDASVEKMLKTIIPKVVLIRKAKRYLAKGNYNIFRVKYLASLFPESRFVICFRNPFEHAHSLARVHELFSHDDNKYAGEQMAILGHFEFGTHRKPIGDTAAQEKAWDKAKDYEGYLYQWLEVYQGVCDRYLKDKSLKKQILLFENEALQETPEKALKKLFKFCDLKTNDKYLKSLAGKVAQRNSYKAQKIDPALRKKVEDLYKNLKSHV